MDTEVEMESVVMTETQACAASVAYPACAAYWEAEAAGTQMKEAGLGATSPLVRRVGNSTVAIEVPATVES